jgi:hypothetical protein
MTQGNRMRKADRLFQLTNILRKHQPITAKQLAKKWLSPVRRKKQKSIASNGWMTKWLWNTWS